MWACLLGAGLASTAGAAGGLGRGLRSRPAFQLCARRHTGGTGAAARGRASGARLACQAVLALRGLDGGHRHEAAPLLSSMCLGPSPHRVSCPPSLWPPPLQAHGDGEHRQDGARAGDRRRGRPPRGAAHRRHPLRLPGAGALRTLGSMLCTLCTLWALCVLRALCVLCTFCMLCSLCALVDPRSCLEPLVLTSGWERSCLSPSAALRAAASAQTPPCPRPRNSST